jgi:hypothetical protein
MQIAFTPYPQTPTRMFRQRMQHVIQESNTTLNIYDLRLCALRRMAIAILLCLRFFVFEVSAVQTQGQLDLRLIRVACDRTVSSRI